MDRKGQEMSVTTLILIVLGVVLLVLIVLGFSMGWTNLWAKINIFQGGTTLDFAVQACKISALSDASASFCEFKLVTIDGVKQYVNCRDGRVSERLERVLNCDDATMIKKQCANLEAQKVDLTKMIVNGQLCPGSSTSTSNVPITTPSAGSGAIAIALPESSFDISEKVILEGTA